MEDVKGEYPYIDPLGSCKASQLQILFFRFAHEGDPKS